MLVIDLDFGVVLGLKILRSRTRKERKWVRNNLYNEIIVKTKISFMCVHNL